MKTKLHFVLISLIILGSCYSGYGQEIGKIYSKTEANLKYPPVKKSFSMNNSELNSLLKQAGKYIMLNVKNGKLIILGQKRNALYPSNISVSASQVFKAYSTDMVSMLLTQGKENTTIIEYRDSIISLTNGDYTLERSINCPPFCP